MYLYELNVQLYYIVEINYIVHINYINRTIGNLYIFPMNYTNLSLFEIWIQEISF